MKDRSLQVVGIVKDAKYHSKTEPPLPFFYVPLRQNFRVQNSLLIRTPETPGALLKPLAREVHALDPNLAPLIIERLQDQIDQIGYSQRLAVALVALFGGIALFLAAIGLYAVMSYSVSQGTRELGLRMALGAETKDLIRLVMSRGLLLTASGVAIGILAAIVLTHLMSNMLYKVGPRDPLAFGLALAVITIASLAACFFPAWRATRIDPTEALREQ
jgi:predicted lysophospholipase L1 biosynthesis ABC-type transport system permease subunit